MKQLYVIRGAAGVRNVVADDELEARHLAMCLRWGPPSGIYANHTGKYLGLGLDIVSISPLGVEPPPVPEEIVEAPAAKPKKRKGSALAASDHPPR